MIYKLRGFIHLCQITQFIVKTLKMKARNLTQPDCRMKENLAAHSTEWAVLRSGRNIYKESIFLWFIFIRKNKRSIDYTKKKFGKMS